MTPAGLTVLTNRNSPAAQSSEVQALEQALRAAVRGPVHFDAGARALYATDASNYRQVPWGVVAPLDAADVHAALAACRAHNAPMLMRGAGTSLAGQACNAAVVLDFSRYMHGILELNPEEKFARVQPGIVLDRVREAAEAHHLTFAPDPATHNRCTLGGMIGNNACGVHALMGGKTVDNIERMRVLLYDGTEMEVGPTSEAEMAAILAQGGRRGAIYAELQRIRSQYAGLIREKFPKIPRRVSGYNLDELLPENGCNVARALVGSEGTCVTVLEAKLILRPSPAHRVLVALGFADAFAAADHVPQVLEHKPIGLEGFDALLVEFMRRKHLAVEDVALLPDGGGHMLVEMGGWSAPEVMARAEALVAACRQFAAPPTARIYSAEQALRVWHVRESALGATVFVPGEPHGWEGWEDSAVPVEQLGSYLRELSGVLQRYGYRTPLYGHFGQGCVHMRMNFDLESAEGIRKFREFLDEATDTVLRHGGSISGEHGDGQARAALLPKMFGPELMQAFRDFKAAWDPTNRMNPGKLVDPVAVYQPEENLRLGAGFQLAQTETHFAYPADGGSFAHAALRCVGVGACRKTDSGTMCPSYMVTGEEQHSTRGRAHLLWEMLQGELRPEGWKSEAVHQALELCLSCKACKSECPVQVDMATYKAEFLSHYYAGRLRPLRAYAFGWMDRWARLAAVAPGLVNACSQNPLGAGLAKRLLGIAPERRLPRFADEDFRSTMRRRQLTVTGKAAQSSKTASAPLVFLWADTWNNFLHPQALHAASAVLARAGFQVQTAQRHLCCGRGLYDFGMLGRARRYLRTVLDALASQLEAGTPIVVLEPSCASVFRDELLNFFPDDARAVRLAQQTYLLAEFLARHAPQYTPPSLAGRDVLLHGHCHQKSQMQAEQSLLERAGARVWMPDSGCCGMAGPFGFEKEKYAVSTALGERVLLPAVRAASPETLIVSDGFSCREQVGQLSSRRAMHLAEVLCPGTCADQ
jgi:FAD/FMN-containing dehydrogenase/Fe-S oxidoreductase